MLGSRRGPGTKPLSRQLGGSAQGLPRGGAPKPPRTAGAWREGSSKSRRRRVPPQGAGLAWEGRVTGEREAASQVRAYRRTQRLTRARAAQAGSRSSASRRAASRTPLGAAGEPRVLRTERRLSAAVLPPGPCSAPVLAQGVPVEGTVGTGGRNGPKEMSGPESEITGQPLLLGQTRKRPRAKGTRAPALSSAGTAWAPSRSRNTYNAFLHFLSGPSALDAAFRQSHHVSLSFSYLAHSLKTRVLNSGARCLVLRESSVMKGGENGAGW